MLSGKLTYANVTSTLALFIALAGGVAYGANAIVNDSKDVAAQSIANSDVKKETLKSNRLKDGAAVSGADVIPNSLGGNAINEGDLAQVPSAANAAAATNATDAAALGGLTADQFARSSQIAVGGPLPVDVTTQTPIVSLPNLGLEVRTDGDADLGAEVRFVNSNPPGGRGYLVVYGVDHQNAFVLAPGDNTQIAPGDAINGGIAQVVSANGPSAGLLLSCAFSIFDAHRAVGCQAISSA